MPPYTRATWIDEILAGAARYDILENGGGAFKSTMQINLSTGVTQAGTGLTAARMQNIEGEVQALSDALLYKLAVSVVSNDLVVTLQHQDGTNPTSTRPLWFRIGGIWRSVTTTTTITIPDGTNFFNAGSAELGTKLTGHFAYAVWDSNSSVVALSTSRIPYGRVVTDFNSSTTNEKHLFNYANFTAGGTPDNVANIGYFEATLSLSGTSHLWTVPTFTNVNLRHEPTFETRDLDWTPVHDRVTTTYTNLPTVSNAHYQVVGTKLIIYERHTQHATPGGTGNQRLTLPFTNFPAGVSQNCPGLNVTAFTLFSALWIASSNQMQLIKYDGTAEATASQVYTVEGVMFLK